MYMLMAYGPNDVGVPCRFFEDIEQADAFVNRWMVPMFVHTVEVKGAQVWRVNNTEAAEKAGFYEALFASYYGGCGHALAFKIFPLPCDRPFVNWNLD